MSSSKISIVLAATALLVSVLFATPLGQAASRLVVPQNSVGTVQIKKSAVTGPKVKDNSLTGVDVLESTLGTVPSALKADSATNADHSTSANTATSSSTATNAAQLGGIAAAGYQQKCATGTIKGYVLVHGSAGFPSTYTSDPTKVSSPYNCGGGSVEAKRLGAGHYEVRFNGNQSALAFGSQEISVWIGAVEFEPIAPGDFQVYIASGNTAIDDGFVMALL